MATSDTFLRILDMLGSDWFNPAHLCLGYKPQWRMVSQLEAPWKANVTATGGGVAKNVARSRNFEDARPRQLVHRDTR